MKNIVFITLLLSLSSMMHAQNSDESALLKAMHSITSDDLFNYVKIQCDDKYEGRLTGTEGYQSSARWLAGEFSQWGIQPAGDSGKYFQWFDIPYTLVYPGCGLSLHMPVKKGSPVLKHYEYVTEFMPGSTSGCGQVSGEVVYAGYGITAPEIGYDDYAGIDVRGKVILIEREAPVDPSAGPDKFNPWYSHSFHQAKLANAVKHGATGMIYNYGPLANPNNDYYEKFIWVHVGDTVVNDVFTGTGFNHDSVVKEIKRTLKPRSFNTKKSVTITMNTKHFPDGRGSNIIGYLKGSDPLLGSETIIIGAHLDHLGRCWEIIPGANDNASAVAVMMGIAKALAENKILLKRSVAFIAFGSEEQGVKGSKAYLEDPVFTPDKSILINMDGVGTGDSISANAGKNFPVLWSFVEQANNDYIHRPLKTDYFANLGRPRLDAARFLTAGVPSLSFSTYGSVSYYHIPQDNIDIIKPEIMEDLSQLILVTVVRMANSSSPLR